MKLVHIERFRIQEGMPNSKPGDPYGQFVAQIAPNVQARLTLKRNDIMESLSVFCVEKSGALHKPPIDFLMDLKDGLWGKETMVIHFYHSPPDELEINPETVTLIRYRVPVTIANNEIALGSK